MPAEAAEPRIAKVHFDIDDPPLNIFATLAHNRALSKAFRQLGSHLLFGEVLPSREREIVILRTGWNCGSEYEFGQHTTIGMSAGLTEAEIRGLVEVGDAEWDENDAALIALVDELCADDVVSGSTWQVLGRRWNDAELLELLVLTGFYRMVSGMLNSVGVALEPQTPRWPDGSTPIRRAPTEEL